ncbi:MULTISPECIES: hypothetical protein [unclassified Tolypothrix]|uniref:hypothetical protein n=1 Tax=unclassified Tolypothrix TaxID=2649714 RepID=UPI0005F89044|nr:MULTISPECIES: hypothetical protein [unclassified Tolypothrix]MBE9083077.1 hypothetical protein [Tolypothrix sp. LEGE 11397]UYD26826.1 hypothetical protein HGR01_01560 [Tolypothrix sp. PCC 7712]UYD37316.1 hypothetical protein HG267_17255 [Tolypothrix sp. PCC 7601]BAY92927.1 hypothetical protein NIES3275_49640 [Microchaete diplosiphon NIES-3275]
MSKLLPCALAAVAFLITSTNQPSTTLAGTCASKCGPHPIQFTPGQNIRLEVVNRTSGFVKLERIQGTEPIPLRPGQELQFMQEEDRQAIMSLVFWHEMGLPLQAVVSKPNFGTLRLELRPGKLNPGDRSLYLLNDGHVSVY